MKKSIKRHKKTLTVFTPFELRTSKRVKLDSIEDEQPKE
jgi:hypothetical protein